MDQSRELAESLANVGYEINQRIKLEKFSKQQLSTLFSSLANSISIGHGIRQFVNYINQGEPLVLNRRNNFSNQLDEVKRLIDSSQIESVEKGMLLRLISELTRTAQNRQRLGDAAYGFVKANTRGR